MAPGSPGFLARYGQVVGLGLIVLLAASFVWSARLLARRTPDITPKKIFLFLILLLLDLAITGFILFVEMPASETTLLLTFTYSLEVALMLITVLIFTIGWGILRTVLFMRRLPRQKVWARDLMAAKS